MKHHKQIKEELEELSPFLNKKLGDDTGFDVPANYFEQLSEDIFEKVALNPLAEKVSDNMPVSIEKSPSLLEEVIHWLRWLLKPQYAIGFALMVGVILTTVYFLQSPTADYSAELTVQELEEYIDNNIDQYSVDLILEVAMIDEETLKTPAIDINKEDLDNYIENNLLDDTDEELLNELM